MNRKRLRTVRIDKMNLPLRKKFGQAYDKGNNACSLKVIIQFKQKATSGQIKALKQHIGPSSFTVQRHLPLINAVSSRVTSQCLRRICSWKGVHKVYEDGRKQCSLYVATPSIGATAVRLTRRLTGKGINIAIIDTGVYRHPDLIRPRNRIVAFKDFVNGRKRPYDDSGHGTHVAGDAAGNGWSSKGKYQGPAPEAGIVALKVLDNEGRGYDSTIIKAIEWCILHRKRLKLRIISLSLGGAVNSPCHDDPLCQAVEKAVKAGLIVIAAAGNSGPNRRTIESPGNSPSAITVGAVDDRRTLTQADDRTVWYSSRGPVSGGRQKPDIVAPGETIISLRSPGSELDRLHPHLRVGKSYFVLSGTSMSTPVVSGAVAQLLQWKPALSPQQVKKLLKRHAFRLKSGINTSGSGEINMRFLQKQQGT